MNSSLLGKVLFLVHPAIHPTLLYKSTYSDCVTLCNNSSHLDAVRITEATRDMSLTTNVNNSPNKLHVQSTCMDISSVEDRLENTPKRKCEKVNLED